MSIRPVVCSAVFLAAFTMYAGAQDNKEVKHVAVKPTSAASGQEMFTNYCAPCHGKDGKGGGPAASALKTPPADLSALAKNNGGKYPAMKVTSVLRGETDLSAHGNQEMPVWGRVFWHMSHGHEAEVQQRIANLNRYVESLQAK